MGKRSTFERINHDFYRTPKEAVEPLLPFLAGRPLYWEPCSGDGDLIRHLDGHAVCAGRSDREKDAREFKWENMDFDFFITNPPWIREILHPIIENLSDQAPTWLLFDADWMFTRQAEPYLKRCRKIVAVGRIRWIPDSPFTGKDNCAWYLFGERRTFPAITFHARIAQ